LQSASAEASLRSCRHRGIAGDGRVVSLHTVVWPSGREDSGRRLEGVTREMGASESGSIDGGGRDELLAMLGHELRNPLAPVVAAARMLRIGDEAARERAGIIIERQVERMGRLIDD